METTTAGAFIAYPTNRVAGTITDAAAAKKAVEDLVAAGFDREVIDVLHGEQDLRRLDPSGGEHGLFAKLQRSLVRGAVGSEFKHLTHHVEDVQAGRFVVMVLAREPRTRDVAAEVLYANGAEFVGFYGRWAYESLPQDSSKAVPATGRTYDISAGQETFRIRLGESDATVLGTPSFPAVATPVGANLWLISWRRNDTAVVHAIDVSTGVAYTSLMSPTVEPTHVKGIVTLVG
jgi:hypothetical protein